MKQSIAAKEVAREVIRQVSKGKKPVLTRIAVEKGYTLSSAKAMKPQRTETYKNEIKPLVDRLEEERNAIVERLRETRDKAKYRDLVDGLDKITKNIQLLSGKATENVAQVVTIVKYAKDKSKKV